MERFELTDAPGYVAVSYTWGKEQARHRVYVDGKVFFVRSNLYEMLRAMISIYSLNHPDSISSSRTLAG
jgi:hypothetical protein